MVASLGSATDLDAVTSLCAIVLDDSQEMKVALCGISAVWRGQEDRKWDQTANVAYLVK
jgi:hypothetical protein